MAATEYAPGTVAIATARGVEGVRVMRTSGTAGADVVWLSADIVTGQRAFYAGEVTDVRPLVVLDTSVPNSSRALGVWLREIAEFLRGKEQTAKGRVLSNLADQIEAQTKPPRIPEPGLWGVVEAASYGGTEREEFVRTPKFWYCAVSDMARGWDALTDPTLIRDGVES